MKILVVHIGPVQEFIESARKCRDLWFGSWLLSELARAAAGAIVKAEGGDEEKVLVFPGAKLSETSRAVANKIVARIQGEPTEVAHAAEKAMRGRLNDIRIRAFAQVAPGLPGREKLFFEQTAIDQVNDLIEFLWASAEERGGDYPSALREADRVLAAVKNAKRWEQPSWAKDGVPKSSLDGVRESVLDESLYPNPKNNQVSRNLTEGKLRRNFGVHQAERLCGVGLLKRFGSTGSAKDGKPQRIFSTSHVASGPFRAGLHGLPGADAAWGTLLVTLRAILPELVEEMKFSIVDDRKPSTEDRITGNIDGSIFYEGRLTEALEELGFDTKTDEAIFQQAREALRKFCQVSKPLGEPIPYYALLLADGDRMGKVISETKDFEAHRRLSSSLEDFASSTRETVQKHAGALVYAGGDDVLALLPLHTVLGCATELSSGFAAKMGGWKVTEQGQTRSPTLSMGIAIVHHLLPLDEALALVRSTEKKAKKVDGKNALAIVVKKRGGEPVAVEGTWGQIDERLRELVQLHRAEAISTKAQYELMDLDARLQDPSRQITSEQKKIPKPLEGTLRKVQEAEARRILARKQPSKGQAEMAEKTRESLGNLGAYKDPGRLGRELYVAHLLARALEQANPRKEEKTTPVASQEIRP